MKSTHNLQVWVKGEILRHGVVLVEPEGCTSGRDASSGRGRSSCTERSYDDERDEMYMRNVDGKGEEVTTEDLVSCSLESPKVNSANLRCDSSSLLLLLHR